MSKLIVILCLITPFMGLSQNTSIPDTIFEKYLINHGFDSGAIDGIVPTANLSTVYVLTIQNLGIKSLQGIEDMTSLVYLDCSNNDLTSLDLSNNHNLVNFLCHQNKINNLTVGQNSKLLGIYAPYNQITNIDISLCPKITSLEFRYNNLTAINVDSLSELIYLGIAKNNISTLNLIKNQKLKRLDCSKNNLNVLDVSSNFLLDSLVCDTNNLTKLNVSNLKNLHTLMCHHNQIDGTIDVSDNLLLKVFSCSNNSVDLVNINNCPSLERIFVGNNQLTSLDISACPKAYFLDFCSNNLLYLNLKNGNNINFFTNPCLWGNNSLTCVVVDDPIYSKNNWAVPNNIKFNLTCNSSIANINACNSYKWLDDSTYTVSTNTPIYVIHNGAVNGLDSTIYLNLNIVQNNTTISQSGNTLTANQSEVAYQWLNCTDNYAVINGAIQQSFTPITTGSYAVVIKNGNCIDTSTCFTILGLDDITNLDSKYTIYPNPSQGNFTIQLNSVENETISISMYTILGELVQNQTLTTKANGKNTFDLNSNQSLNEGLYFIKIKNGAQIENTQRILIKY